MINIQPGHIARHTPRGAGSQGYDAAIIDVAQDLLLRHLHEKNILNRLVFKGGTALRKLYAGNAGRFSLDLDFSIAKISDSANDILLELVDTVDSLSIGPINYGTTERRGKWYIEFSHHFGPDTGNLYSKLDISPPSWMTPTKKDWIAMPIHATYGEPKLPKLTAILLEENIAEKIARLNRATPVRDLYDLKWIMTTVGIAQNLDLSLIRHLSVLKIWSDANGVNAGNTCWRPGHKTIPFNPEHFLRDRSNEDIDIDDIGALAIPVPTAKDLSESLSKHFKFLQNLTTDEKIIAQVREQDRSLALKMLRDLPGGRLSNIGLY